MTRTIIGLFDTFGEAQSAVEDLMRFGIARDAISLVSRDEQRSAEYEREIGAASGAAEGAGAGAVGGSLVGGALGLLVGTGLLVIPGIGPVLAAGPLAGAIGTITAAAGATALGAGIGAAAGGLLGGLMGAGVPEEDARAYVEGVRRGGTLLTVNAADVEADDVREIMLRNGAIDIGRRADEWRASGNVLWQTGRPINCFGNHPTDAFAAEYGSEAFYCGGVLTPRGTAGRTRQMFSLDLGLQYRPNWAQDRLAIGVDVFNVLDNSAELEVNEIGEFDFDPDSYPLSTWGVPTTFQAPREVRFSVSYDF